MSGLAQAVDVSRPHLAFSRQLVARWRGRPLLLDAELLAAIQVLVSDLPTDGYRRAHALLRRQAEGKGRPAPNVKRLYRVMKVYGLPLHHQAGGAETRRHKGQVATDVRNTLSCSNGFENADENDEQVRVAFALDYCGREAMTSVATITGLADDGMRNLMETAVEHGVGRISKAPSPIDSLADKPGAKPH